MTDLKAFDADPNRLWSDTNNMTAEAREAALRERLSALHAGETGHMHRCARVNGTWSCASGCAMPRAAAAEADARVVRAQLGELLRHCDVLTAECCVFAVAASRAILTPAPPVDRSASATEGHAASAQGASVPTSPTGEQP